MADPRQAALLALLALAGLPPAQAPAPEELFYQGFYLEMGAEDPAGAARLYVAFLRHADRSHPLAGQAAARLEALLARLPAAAGGGEAGPIRGWGEVNRQDWDRPNLIPWQRSLDDALALAKRLGRPLFLCVNMDDEPASETFAARKYRDPAFAALAARFVPVIASPHRHNPQDHDAQGRRILCPRFGVVTCGEHMAAEQEAFVRYFPDNRVAPRHIGLAPDGRRLFDHFLEGDLSLVDADLARFAGPAPEWLLASRDARDREALEALYLRGDPAARRALLAAAALSPAEPFDLLRLGLAEPDPGLRFEAARALGATATGQVLPLLLQTLRRVEPGSEADRTLLGALARLSRSDPAAANLVAARQALEAPSVCLEPELWLPLLAAAPPPVPRPAPDIWSLNEALDAAAAAARQGDPDGTRHLQLAELNLEFALARIGTGKDPAGALEDADRAAREAQKHEECRSRALAVRAQAAWLLNQPDEAIRLSTAALPGLLAAAATPPAAEVLAVHARGHAARIYEEVRAGRPLPPAAVTEAHRAYQLLAAHPGGGSEEFFREHADLLASLGVHHATGAVLENALRRYPVSPELHERWRAHLWREGDPARLEEGYAPPGPWGEKALAEHGPHLEWFAAFAVLLGAEERVRQGRRADARAAYDRAMARFAASAAAASEFKDTVDHFTCLALAGQGWLALDEGGLGRAVELLLQAAARRPASFKDADGLGRTPEGLARRLEEELDKAGEGGLKARLEEGLRAVRGE